MFSDDIFDSVTALENHEITFEDFKKTMMTIIKNHRENKDMYLNINPSIIFKSRADAQISDRVLCIRVLLAYQLIYAEVCGGF